MVSRHVWADCNPEDKSVVKCLTRRKPGRFGRKAAICCDHQNSPRVSVSRSVIIEALGGLSHEIAALDFSGSFSNSLLSPFFPIGGQN